MGNSFSSSEVSLFALIVSCLLVVCIFVLALEFFTDFAESHLESAQSGIEKDFGKLCLVTQICLAARASFQTKLSTKLRGDQF